MRRCVFVFGAVVLVLSACSSDSKSGADTTTPNTVGLPTTSSTKPSATTSSTATTEAATTTTVPGPTYPLTGLPMVNPAAATRPAMVVKIDNHPDARPQSGLNEADIVYEENVEHLTRFAAVFQSNGADPVGPIRSGRTQDIALLGSLKGPMFIWSGGNRKVSDAIQASDFFQVNQNGPLFRMKGRASPHNLYGNVSDLYDLAPASLQAPPTQFEYRAAGVESKGDPVVGAKLSMDGTDVLWQWDEASKTFLRFSDGVAHRDTVGDAQLSTENVVVLSVDYVPSPADGRSPEAQTLGTGEAWVYSDGKLVSGTWTRNDRLDPFTLTAADGTTMELTPGRTFVELARAGKAATVPAGTASGDVAYP